jgi:hypothetical protein
LIITIIIEIGAQLRENCLKRVREDRTRLLWKCRSSSSSPPTSHNFHQVSIYLFIIFTLPSFLILKIQLINQHNTSIITFRITWILHSGILYPMNSIKLSNTIIIMMMMMISYGTIKHLIPHTRMIAKRYYFKCKKYFTKVLVTY